MDASVERRGEGEADTRNNVDTTDGNQREEHHRGRTLARSVAPEIDIRNILEQAGAAPVEVHDDNEDSDSVQGDENEDENGQVDTTAAVALVAEVANEVWTALLPELRRYYDEDLQAALLDSHDFCNNDDTTTLALGSMDLLTLVSLPDALDETIAFLRGGTSLFRTVEIDFEGSNARTWGMMAMAMGQDVLVSRLWRLRTCLGSLSSVKCLKFSDLDPSECGVVAEFFLASAKQVEEVVLTLKGDGEPREEDDSRCSRLRDSLNGHGALERFTLIVDGAFDFPLATCRLCSALSSCPKLSSVSVHRVNHGNENGLTSIHEEVVNDVLRAPSLGALTLDNFFVSAHCVQALQRCLCLEESAIKTFDIGSCEVESEESLCLLFEAISDSSSSLERIELPRLLWTDSLCDSVNRWLLSSTNLKHLTLGDTGRTLTSERLTAMLACSKGTASMSLRSLRLVNLSLTDSDTIHLVTLLEKCCTVLPFLEVGFCNECSILDRPLNRGISTSSRCGLIQLAKFVQEKATMRTLVLSDASIRLELSRIKHANHWTSLKISPTDDESWQPSETNRDAVFWYLKELHQKFRLHLCDLSKCMKLKGVMAVFVPIATQSLDLKQLVTFEARQCSNCGLFGLHDVKCSNCVLRKPSFELPEYKHVASLLKLNSAGRGYIRINPSSKALGVGALVKVNDDLDCVYIHLRENPILCCRDFEMTNTSKR